MGCMILPGLWRFIIGIPLLCCSTWQSYKILSAETTIIEKLRQKVISFINKKNNRANDASDALPIPEEE